MAASAGKDCVFCYERAACWCADKCTHTFSCDQCFPTFTTTQHVTRCPVCRATVTGYLLKRQTGDARDVPETYMLNERQLELQREQLAEAGEVEDAVEAVAEVEGPHRARRPRRMRRPARTRRSARRGQGDHDDAGEEDLRSESDVSSDEEDEEDMNEDERKTLRGIRRFCERGDEDYRSSSASGSSSSSSDEEEEDDDDHDGVANAMDVDMSSSANPTDLPPPVTRDSSDDNSSTGSGSDGIQSDEDVLTEDDLEIVNHGLMLQQQQQHDEQKEAGNVQTHPSFNNSSHQPQQH